MKTFNLGIYLYYLLICISIISCKHDNTIIIKGDIKGLNAKMVYLKNIYPVGSPPFDSAKVLNGKFEFKFNPDTIFQPNLVFIEYFNQKHQIESLTVLNPYEANSSYQAFIMEPGTTTLIGYVTKGNIIKLDGGKQNEFYFKNIDLPFIRISKDSVKRQAQAERIRKLVNQNPDAYWIRFALDNFKYEFDKKQLNAIYSEFSDNIKQSYQGKKLKDFIDFQPKNKNDFSDNQLFDRNDNPINLIDKTKKLNMIVFWASWCGPCRMEIPALKRIASKINSKDLRIVSVSIDDKKDRWLKAVNQEKMPWQQLIIQADKKEQVTAQYNLGFIPQIFLVDAKNKVLKKIDGFDNKNEVEVIMFMNQYLSK